MNIDLLNQVLPMIITLIIGMLGGRYHKAKALLKAVDEALEDDRITPEEIEVFRKIIKGE